MDDTYRTYFGSIMDEVYKERQHQLQKWGDQNNRPNNFKLGPSGTLYLSQDGEGMYHHYGSLETFWKTINDCPDTAAGWDSVLLEEIYECLHEDDYEPKRKEAIQCIAVLVAMIESMDAKAKANSNEGG